MITPRYRVDCPLCKGGMGIKNRGKDDCWLCRVCKTRVFVTAEQQVIQERLSEAENDARSAIEKALRGEAQ